MRLPRTKISPHAHWEQLTLLPLEPAGLNPVFLYGALWHANGLRQDAGFSCGAARPVAKERWRYEGQQYRRIEGKVAAQPALLKKLWGR